MSTAFLEAQNGTTDGGTKYTIDLPKGSAYDAHNYQVRSFPPLLPLPCPRLIISDAVFLSRQFRLVG